MVSREPPSPIPARPGKSPLDHTADLGVLVEGESSSDLFGRAAVALFDALVEIRAVRPLEADSLILDVSGLPVDEALRDFLSELLYRFYTRRRVYAACDVELEAGRIRATLHGETYDRERHGGKIEVKGVTFHGLSVSRNEAGLLEARIIFDV